MRDLISNEVCLSPTTAQHTHSLPYFSLFPILKIEILETTAPESCYVYLPLLFKNLISESLRYMYTGVYNIIDVSSVPLLVILVQNRATAHYSDSKPLLLLAQMKLGFLQHVKTLTQSMTERCKNVSSLIIAQKYFL